MMLVLEFIKPKIIGSLRREKALVLLKFGDGDGPNLCRVKSRC